MIKYTCHNDDVAAPTLWNIICMAPASKGTLLNMHYYYFYVTSKSV